jgi:hypothetical protein
MTALAAVPAVPSPADTAGLTIDPRELLMLGRSSGKSEDAAL